MYIVCFIPDILPFLPYYAITILYSSLQLLRYNKIT